MSASLKKGTFVFYLCFSCVSVIFAQNSKFEGMPPTPVVVSTLKVDVIAPEAEYVGTVCYPEVSDVAAESSGPIEAVYCTEGQRTKKGDLLVKIHTELLERTIQGTLASHEEVLINLEKAKTDLSRIENLYQRKVVSEQLLNESRFKVQSLEKKACSLLADTARLTVELQKKSVRAPFDGIVIKRWVSHGEWLQPGSTVATLARDDVMDVVVEILEGTTKLIHLGMDVNVKVLGNETIGKISAIVPRADSATRTLPIKVKITNAFSLVEGMEARVRLPSMEPRESFVAPRNAVMTVFGTPVVFVVVDFKTKMVPVKVIGYQGSLVGIEGKDLSKGMRIVVKGNERLRDDQSVTVIPEKK